MEPAFGGVKSNQLALLPLFGVHRRCLLVLESLLSFGIYSGMISLQSRKAYDRFLRQLRAGGRTNMYGAVPYLMKAFGLDRDTAFQIVCEWLDRQAELSREELAAPKLVRHR